MMMKVTGFEIREGIKRHTLRKEAAELEFKDSLTAFPSEHKSDPREALKRMQAAEEAVVQLQAAQQWFNQQVTVDGESRPTTLAVAVKLIGVYGRWEQLLRKAAGLRTGDKHDDYYEHVSRRNASKARAKDDEYAVRMLSVADASHLAEQASERAGRLRVAVAKASLATVDIPDTVVHKLAALLE